MKRNINFKLIGLLIVFGGIFIPIIMFIIWGEIYDPQAGLFYNVQKSKLVFKRKIDQEKLKLEDKNINSIQEYKEYKRYIQKEISIHFKYIAAIGIMVVFFGIGVIFTEEFERF